MHVFSTWLLAGFRWLTIGQDKNCLADVSKYGKKLLTVMKSCCNRFSLRNKTTPPKKHKQTNKQTQNK